MSNATRHIKVSVSVEKHREDIVSLLRDIRPEWKEDCIEIKRTEAGLINKTFKIVHNKNTDDGLVLRINGDIVEKIGLSRPKEIGYINLLNQHGLGVPLIATFENGIVSKMMPGKALDDESISHLMYDVKFSGRIAKMLAEIHHLKPNEDTYTTFTTENSFLMRCVYLCIEDLQKIKDDPGLKKITNMISWDEAAKEMEFIHKEAEKMKIPACLSHNDVWQPNILYDKISDKITIIDYEIMEMNFDAYDVGSFLMGVTNNSLFPVQGSQQKVDPNFSAAFVRNYLEHKASLEGRNEAVTDEEVDTYLKWTNLCTLILLASWPTLVFIMLCHKTDDGSTEYADLGIKWYEEYLKLKKKCGY